MKFGKKVKSSIKKEFDSEPAYNEKHLKAKKNLVMEKSAQISTIINVKRRFLMYFLSVILIDSVFRTSKNYYPQVFLEEYKYIVKE